MNINVNKHSSIQIDDIFIDPYLISNKSKKAKYILITHPHYDHLSIDDIDKVVLPETIFVAPKDAKETLERRYGSNKIYFVSPNEKLAFDDFALETYPAYNTNKQFHQRDYNWLGYKILKDGTSYYICGDTDITLELETVKCDVLFIPIGGTFTMDALEASRITNKIEPKIVVPVHYGSVVGSKKDAETFKANVNENIEVRILIK